MVHGGKDKRRRKRRKIFGLRRRRKAEKEKEEKGQKNLFEEEKKTETEGRNYHGERKTVAERVKGSIRIIADRIYSLFGAPFPGINSVVMPQN